MVMVRVHMMEGRTTQQKAELISRLTSVVTETLAVVPDDVRVLLLEIPTDSWGIAGTPANVLRAQEGDGRP